MTTADHLFYTVAGEWVEAGDLRLGDDIRMASWATGDVESVYLVTQPQPMYNFTVAIAHTYFVGEHQWLVHNSNGCPIPSAPGGMSLPDFGEMIGWGTGQTGTTDSLIRLEILTEGDIINFRNQGLSADMAQEWADWYQDVSISNPNNPSSAGRAEQMQYIADWISELE